MALFRTKITAFIAQKSQYFVPKGRENDPAKPKNHLISFLNDEKRLKIKFFILMELKNDPIKLGNRSILL